MQLRSLAVGMLRGDVIPSSDFKVVVAEVARLFTAKGYEIRAIYPVTGPRVHLVMRREERLIGLMLSTEHKPMSIRTIRVFADALRDSEIECGYVVSPAGFDEEAVAFVADRQIALLDGAAMGRLFREAGISGVESPIVIPPPPCPECGHRMFLEEVKGRRALWKCGRTRLCSGSRELSTHDKHILRKVRNERDSNV